MGDSAFAASPIVMPPFKSAAGAELPRNTTSFNTLLAKPRVKSELCMGIFKGRFPFMKGMRLLIGNKMHLEHIIDCVRGTMALHNFPINEPAEASWVAQEECVDN